MTSARPTAAAVDLLNEIAAWCRRTRTKETLLGRHVLRHDGFVALLRKRLKVTEESAGKMRQFMAAHPKGVAGLPVPNMFLKGPKPSIRDSQRHMMEAATGPRCRMCGAPGLLPCGYPSCPKREAA